MQPEPETLQFTAVLVVPVTVAVNCCVPPSGTEAEVGETLTEMVGGGGVVPPPPPPQAARSKAAQRAMQVRN